MKLSFSFCFDGREWPVPTCLDGPISAVEFKLWLGSRFYSPSYKPFNGLVPLGLTGSTETLIYKLLITLHSKELLYILNLRVNVIKFMTLQEEEEKHLF